jgi:4-hydroxybenzoate polyprenyltransferase
VTAATTAAEPLTRGGVRGFLRLVAIEHSVFALPFAYVAALTAMKLHPFAPGEHGAFVDGVAIRVRWADLLLVTVAMVAARTFAMAANRVIDRELDARNPRTATRELVTGALPVRTAVAGMAVSLAVFLASAALLDPLCLALAPVALVPLTLYPYAKRVTWLCHYVLGLAQAIAPVGAWVAVTKTTSGWLPAIWLGLAVGTWIAAFDLIYACQDIDSDRREGVHSLPARFGAKTALAVSIATHVVTVALLVAFGISAGRGAIWYAGVALTAAALAYEHALSRVNRAFFTVNGWVGVGLFAFALADLLA